MQRQNANMYDYSYSRNRIKSLNSNKIKWAEAQALKMRINPTPIEKAMTNCLDFFPITYIQQKPFYIKSKEGLIERIYIVDFYLPKYKTIIEMDGKFHKDTQEYDDVRTMDIKRQNKGIKIVRFTYKDLKKNKPYFWLKKLCHK